MNKTQLQTAAKWLREHGDICRGVFNETLSLDDVRLFMLEASVAIKPIAEYLENQAKK